MIAIRTKTKEQIPNPECESNLCPYTCTVYLAQKPHIFASFPTMACQIFTQRFQISFGTVQIQRRVCTVNGQNNSVTEMSDQFWDSTDSEKSKWTTLFRD